MVTTMKDIMHPGRAEDLDPSFPNAPEDWRKAEAEAAAKAQGLELGDEHWEAIRVLQACYMDEKAPRARLLHDALDARFQNSGGIKHLFELFPGGPIAQGCVLAGVTAPSGSVDAGGGTVR